MLKQFETYLSKHPQLLKSKLFLAISGGVDSMVLSYLLSHFDIKHTLLHCNFQLRDVESDADEQFLIDFAKTNCLKIETIRFDTKSYVVKHKLSTQEAARELRYKWFNSFLDDEDCFLLTAHHLDDAIETFFINLLRGTGLKGLTGISNNENQIIRPLLNFNKSEIIDFAQKNNIDYREDSSNASDNYLRNKLRHHIVPELKKLTENLDTKMLTMFDDLKSSNDWIEQSINEVKNNLESDKKISITELNTYPTFLWHKIFSKFGLSRKTNPELIKLVNGKIGAILNIGNFKILKDRTEILISNQVNKSSFIEKHISKTDNLVELNESFFKIEQITNQSSINFKPNTAYLDIEKLIFPLHIRKWKQGDKIQPLGMTGSKLISDVFTDKKMTQFQKESQLVITSNQKTIWLVDVMISNTFAISSQTKSILKIEHIKY